MFSKAIWEGWFLPGQQMKNISLLSFLLYGLTVSAETLQDSMQKTQDVFLNFLEYPVAVVFFIFFYALILWGITLLLSFLFSRMFAQTSFVPAFWKPWDILVFVFFYFACFVLLSSLIQSLASLSKEQEYFSHLAIYWVVNIFCLFALFFFLSFLPGYDKKSLGLCSIRRKEALGVVLGYISFLPWYLFLFYCTHLLFALFHLKPQVQEVALKILSSQGFIWWFAVATAILVAPLIEEFLFRVFLYGVLREYFGKVWAVIFTSILFSLMHQNLFAFLPILGLGIFLQILYEKKQCLWYCILAHSLHNILTLLYLL